MGYGLFINDAGALEFKIGKGRGKVETFSTKKAMMRKVWYKVMVSYDASTGKGFICQMPYLTATNGGHGPSMLHPRSDTEAEKNFKVKNGPARITSAPFMMASSAKDPDCGRTVSGAHYGQLAEPWSIPEHTQKYNGKIDRPRITNRALSRAEIELIMGAPRMEAIPTELRESIVAAWDFSANIRDNAASTHIVDMGPHRLHGVAINLPVRGTPGHNWSSHFMSFIHGPQEYGAIHFHDETVDDARWRPSFTMKIPDRMVSGVYAARLRVKGQSTPEYEDYIPFFVRPPKGTTTAKIALVMPTHSYMAYANDNLSVNSVVAQLLTGQVPLLQPGDLLLNQERGYGLGTYASYRDGWGVNVSSRLRPILNMRPKYLHVLSPSIWQLMRSAFS
jgi:N,N-dimethylformamidase